MRFAIVRNGVVWMVVAVRPAVPPPAIVLEVADDADVVAGDSYAGGTFAATGPRPRVPVGDRYALAGYNATQRAIERLPAAERAAAYLRGKP